MLGKLGIEIVLESFTIRLRKRHGSSDIEVMQEVRDMKEY